MTDKQKANQEELAVSATKRIWVKPTIEIISVETGVNRDNHERNVTDPLSKAFYYS